MPKKLCNPLRITGIGLVFIVSLSTVLAEEKPTPPTFSADQIAELVEKLGADSYLERESSHRLLLSAGIAARPMLEKALEGDDVERRLRAENILRELRRDEIWTPSVVTLNAASMPVLDAFREIADQTQNPVNWELTPKSLNRNVDMDWKGETYWQAMDTLSRQADVIPRFYDDPKRAGVVLTHGYLTEGPVDYWGPTRATLLYIRHMQSETLNFADSIPDRQDNLELTMALHWEQQFALCRYGQPVVLEAVTDADESLTVEKKPKPHQMHVTRRQRQLVFTIRLAPAKSGARGLKKLRLALPLVAAGNFTTLEIPAQSAPRSHRDGFSLELVNKVEDEKGVDLTLEWTRPNKYDKMNATDMADEYLEVFDSSGNSLAFNQRKVLGNAVQAQYTVHIPAKVGKPAGIRYQAATLKSEKTLEFTFQEVPLPSTMW